MAKQAENKQKDLIIKASANTNKTPTGNALATIKTTFAPVNIKDGYSATAIIRASDEFEKLSLLAKIKALWIVNKNDFYKDVYCKQTGKKYTKFYDYCRDIARLGKTQAAAYVKAGEYLDDNLQVLLPHPESVLPLWRGSSLLIIVDELTKKKGENRDKILEYLEKGYITPDLTDDRIKREIKDRLSGKKRNIGDEIDEQADEQADEQVESAQQYSVNHIIDTIVRRYYFNKDFEQLLVEFDEKHRDEIQE